MQNERGDTIDYCLLYINRALNCHVKTMVEDVAYNRDFAITTKLFKETAQLKRMVEQKIVSIANFYSQVFAEMRRLITVVLGVLKPPHTTNVPYVELLFGNGNISGTPE